ncbi:MAG: PIG-L family deacetylase [Clostridiales bacterium]
MKKNLFISPHLDDVVLSCGEYLKKLSNEGENITVMTIFSGFPEPASFSKIAREYHAKCKVYDDVIFKRKEEDIFAMEYYGADYIHLDFFEALYRLDKYGNHRFKNVSDIFNKNVLAENDTVSEIKEKICNTIDFNLIKCIYIPLCLGNHIDHILTSKAVIQLLNEECNDIEVYYYEDVPYSFNLIDEKWDIDYMCKLNADVFDISYEEWSSKLIGIDFYESQVRALWKNKDEKIYQLNTLAFYLSYTERKIRFWKNINMRLNSKKMTLVKR